MKILQVTHTDLVGKRFNGYELSRHLRSVGHDSRNCVWRKESRDPGTWELWPTRYKTLLNTLWKSFERRTSVQALLHPAAFALAADRRFRWADVVHYHLIHTGFFSLAALPLLSRIRPAIWTLHDPWPLTGHCVHPGGCERWTAGCGNCPDLDTQWAVKRDRTALNWRAKKFLYRASKLDVVVSSRWMRDLVSRSPLMEGLRVHHIPLGVDLNVFRPLDTEECRRRLGVFPGSQVISFRASPSEFKGLDIITQCLRRLDSNRPLCLITFNDRGLLDEFRGRYQIIDLGWVDDDELAATAYNASDVFLMPSQAEAFGLMAVEAMACGRPVVVCDGTSLPDTVFAPRGGIAVPRGDSDALLAVLKFLLGDDEVRRNLGQSALELAIRHYDFRDHAARLLGFYREISERQSK